jgi:Family of unknown function (DUF6516)
MAKAKIIVHTKTEEPDGAITELKVWRLPEPTEERPHGLKYSFYFGRDGARIIAYDNERGKGDHRHFLEHEEKYNFVSIEKLISDFLNDLKKYRSKK